jgi:hypothetical protein
VRKLEAARSRLEEELKIARAAVEEARKVQQECDRRRVENERLQVRYNACPLPPSLSEIERLKVHNNACPPPLP